MEGEGVTVAVLVLLGVTDEVTVWVGVAVAVTVGVLVDVGVGVKKLGMPLQSILNSSVAADKTEPLYKILA